jgi:futalosine hydrolase
MKILIVAATEGEIALLSKAFGANWADAGNGVFTKGELTVELLLTGVGMIRTSYALGIALTKDAPDLCINAGIAGSFPGKFKIGDVVHVVKDCLPEMGATDSSEAHLSMSDLKLAEDISSADGLINSDAGAFDFLPKANGITVNTVHGDLAGIQRLHDRFSSDDKKFPFDVETMESAAFFYCCLKENVPFIAIRSISNLVESRDRSKWNIPLAVENLNHELLELIEMFAEGE